MTFDRYLQYTLLRVIKYTSRLITEHYFYRAEKKAVGRCPSICCRTRV